MREAKSTKKGGGKRPVRKGCYAIKQSMHVYV